jgi:hypothetical protein
MVVDFAVDVHRRASPRARAAVANGRGNGATAQDRRGAGRHTAPLVIRSHGVHHGPGVVGHRRRRLALCSACRSSPSVADQLSLVLSPRQRRPGHFPGVSGAFFCTREHGANTLRTVVSRVADNRSRSR